MPPARVFHMARASLVRVDICRRRPRKEPCMVPTGAPALVMLVLVAQSGWTAAGGRETFTYRDVARTSPPVDASPIEWTGSGPSLTATYERGNETRAHRVLVDVASAG